MQRIWLIFVLSCMSCGGALELASVETTKQALGGEGEETVPCPGSQMPPAGQICREECYRPPPPVVPPVNCTYEIRFKGATVNSGQGLTEGTLELSGAASVDGAAAVGWSGAEIGPGTSAYADQLLGTISVPYHKTVVSSVSVSFTEDDDGGANGQNDTGTGASLPAILTCPGPAKVVMPSLPVLLVGNKTGEANGLVTFTVEYILVDADDDGVENEEDYTRTDCEEHNKGKLGEAVVIYEEYDDGPVNSLAQAAGIRVNNAYSTTYEGLALIYTDKPINNLFGIDQALKAKANLLLPPTVKSLDTAFKEFTRKGYAIDVWLLAHGMTKRNTLGECAPYPTPPPGSPACNNSHISASAAEDDKHIDEAELLYWFAPSSLRTGTGELPLRMVYLGACYGNDFADTFTTIGAKVTSGTLGVNPYPQKFNDMASRWVNGETYGAAVAISESNAMSEVASEAFISTIGFVKFGCIDVFSSLDCADDFWTIDSTEVGDKTAYPQLSYDFSLSGGDNMKNLATRVITGNSGVRRTSTLAWQ